MHVFFFTCVCERVCICVWECVCVFYLCLCVCVCVCMCMCVCQLSYTLMLLAWVPDRSFLSRSTIVMCRYGDGCGWQSSHPVYWIHHRPSSISLYRRVRSAVLSPCLLVIYRNVFLYILLYSLYILIWENVGPLVQNATMELMGWWRPVSIDLCVVFAYGCVSMSAGVYPCPWLCVLCERVCLLVYGWVAVFLLCVMCVLPVHIAMCC